MSVSTTAPELVCVPSAIPPTERKAHFELARDLLNERAQERVVLPDGYAVRFPAEALAAVARFVSNERKCCPFMTFELTLSSGADSLWLRMTGPEGTREVLDAELNLTSPACTCDKSRGNSAVTWTTAGGMLAALGVCATCCLLPFALVSVGVAGAWVGTLDAMAPYKWIFISAATALLGYGFYAMYWRPKQSCPAGSACNCRSTSRSMHAILWLATLLTLAALVFEQLEPRLLAKL
jgi:mercuric ion transport protein